MSRMAMQVRGGLLGVAVAASLAFGGAQAFAAPEKALPCGDAPWAFYYYCPVPGTDCSAACAGRGYYDGGDCSSNCCRCPT